MRSRPGDRGVDSADGPIGDHVEQLLPAYLNGTLDELTVSRLRNHLAHCSSCALELAAWQAVDRATRASTSPLLLPSDDLLESALAEIDREPRARPEPRQLAPTSHGYNRDTAWLERMTTMSQPVPRPSRNRLSRPLIGAAAAAALAAVLILSPVGSYAEGFLTIFTPHQIAAVAVSPSELQSLPDLNNYGTFTQNRGAKPQHVTSAAAASAASGMTVLVPGTLPGGIPATVSYNVMPGQSASFTFSAAKAKVAAQGKPLPAMPANIDGSSVQVSTGSAVVAAYHDPSKASPAEVAKSAANAQGSSGSGSVDSSAIESMGPWLVIGQTTTPVVTSNGVSAADLEQYLLAQPGISPDLASAIRAIGDPSSTLIIPIPVDKATSHSVQVQGVSGLAVADSTGLGGGIIWTKNGIVYGVAGSLNESDLIAVANSLH